jgi:hypothetical protein
LAHHVGFLPLTHPQQIQGRLGYGTLGGISEWAKGAIKKTRRMWFTAAIAKFKYFECFALSQFRMQQLRSHKYTQVRRQSHHFQYYFRLPALSFWGGKG